MYKKHIITAMLAILLSSAHAQDTSQNYVKTMTMLDASGTNSVKAVQYYNGLGYPTVSVATTGGNGETAYLLTTYDALGREACKYLPVPDANKSIMFKSPDDIIELSSKENNNDNTAYSRNHYDALDRVTSVELPGQTWRTNDKRERSEYSTNSSDEVRIYKANLNGNYSLTKTDKYYPAGSLVKETHKDADDKKVETFKDFLGNVILQRAYDGSKKLDTYYVYNGIGQLCYVLPPKYQVEKTKAITCYEYRYDERGRVYKKILPGAKYIQYWYDRSDRIVGMQDGYMRDNGSQHRFMVYDKFGRLVIQGRCRGYNHNSTFCREESVIAEFDKDKDGFEGTSYILPERFERTIKKNLVLEIVNYYDGNQNLIKGKIREHFNKIRCSPVYSQIGRLTGCLSLASNNKYMAEVTSYDLKGNIISALALDIEGRRLSKLCNYTFTNQVSASSTGVYWGQDNYISIDQDYRYNTIDKLERHTLKINNGSIIGERTLSYKYDELGRLATISRPSSDIKYEYDMRGWLKKITTNSFTEDVFYAEGPGTKYYNGNISSIQWTDDVTKSKIKRCYKYSYDDANRLISGVYCDGGNLDKNKDQYSEYMSYDENGNITNIIRHGRSMSSSGIMDNLTISYNGNQPLNVYETCSDYDFATSFEYKKNNGSGYIFNDNGSLVADKSRKIAYITYDFNNNPKQIYFTNGNVTKYVYSASGQKLRVVHYTAKPYAKTRQFGIKPTSELTLAQILQVDSTDYLLGGSLVITNGKIDKYLFEGGYAQATLSGTDNDKFDFYYYNQDHLGNNREVVDASGVVKQVKGYFPFGATYQDRNAEKGSDLQQYKYNGKELDMMHGLNTYDYGARQYDPILGRWDRIDPLCEEYYSTSPYVYCANNPVRFVDLDGRWYWEKNGNLHAEDNDNTKTLADFLGATQKGVMQILKRNKISVGKNGKINVKKIGDLSLDKSSLYVMTADKSGIVLESESIEENPYVDCLNSPQSPSQTELAVEHYFFGNGEPADVGDKATELLMNTPTFKANLKATTTLIRKRDQFSVDMTGLIFHIGKTPVNYTVHHGSQSSNVDFRLFQYENGKMDSFSDPFDVGIELPGGTKYDYKLRTVTYYFKPVEQ